jgi:hypothetical protein
MIELRLKITKNKILHSYENNGNTSTSAMFFISNSALFKNFKVVCYLPGQRTKLKHYRYSFLMLVRRTNIAEDKIVLRYEKS